MENDLEEKKHNDEVVMTKTIIIAVGCAAGYLILVIGLLIYCKVRRAKQRKEAKVDEAEAEGMMPSKHAFYFFPTFTNIRL